MMSNDPTGLAEGDDDSTATDDEVEGSEKQGDAGDEDDSKEEAE